MSLREVVRLFHFSFEIAHQKSFAERHASSFIAQELKLDPHFSKMFIPFGFF